MTRKNAFSHAGRKALVVGLGDTGAACVRWLLEHDAEVRATDSRAEPPQAQRLREAFPEIVMTMGGFAAADFAWADLVVVSPGVALATPEVAAAVAAGKDVVGDVELFARAIRGSHAKVIVITGSNGKTTVTSLVGHLCAAYGLDTVVAGNIGLPVLEALENRETQGKEPDVWVLELSSFQLETTHSLEADAATVLNISQDHMDRYAGLADYAAAKARIFAGPADGQRSKASCIQVLNRDDALVMAMALPGHTQWHFGLNEIGMASEGSGIGHFGLTSRASGSARSGADDVSEPGVPAAPRKERLWLAEGEEALLPVDKLTIAGLHNAANALAALALCRAIGLDYEGLLPALKTFAGLPHRVQKIDEVAGRKFYDDSKGTNVGATVAALRGFDVPVVLIAGGDGKGQDFSPLREVAGRARAIVLIGRDAPQIEVALSGAGTVVRADSLEDAVERAFRLSRAGDIVLLSPACASWDMFRNYVHRAEVFAAAVSALHARHDERRRAERRSSACAVASERRIRERRRGGHVS